LIKLAVGVDYTWFVTLTRQGVHFVARLQESAISTVVGTREVPEHRGSVNDELSALTGIGAAARCPSPLRRGAVAAPDTGGTLGFLTNHLPFGAPTIARIYQARWPIQLLSKALKQPLKGKPFLGTSATALHTQTWAALIAPLLLRYPQPRSTAGRSLSNLVALLQFQLFTPRGRWAWLKV
jgi:putative transposase